ncbi:TonB-dependent receptor [Lysobacter sp. CFH 32150]|uniref:TonB-dependent receptor plug domain-containing protein n=1 Tax=Lysobacter sp. CFH 32150 TaxID=2927128 RepID=UPI001FA72AF5|nr:TonB-dependent receptor [Lysobacter sp. CFH 32150]MCI4568369.1 TonB-dependent receptor [Lysobacter sp. CFH 32150]
MLAAMSSAIAQEPPTDTLADLSLEELSNIEITSVSKRAQRLSDAPASIFVITAEDIRRSGATSLPEVLRLAPNLEVARSSSHGYAISARGFNSSGNKLQVLMDGRILYTPLFSGVFWDVPDVMLEDVERIEVISGPGATLWGANAVNGVINVITRRSSETQGGLASVNAGNLERNYALRFGASGGAASYRIYGKFFERDPTSRANGATQHDGWDRGEVGFRADWGTPATGFTLQGAAYRGALDTALPNDLRTFGTNLLARWTHQLASGSGVQLQAYFDRSDRDIPGSIRERLKIYDVEFQHNVAGVEGHALTWGISHRGAIDHVINTPAIGFLPADRDLYWTSVFAQDEIALRGEQLKLIGGLRVEHNSYTGTEVLPTLRLAWKPSPSQLAWMALTRAVRTPSRVDRDFFASGGGIKLTGGPEFRSEVANVLAIGYRSQPSPKFSYSVTVFHHDYDDLRSVERRPTGDFVIGNKLEGTGTGLEAWANVQVTEHWRLSTGGTLLDLDLRLKADSTAPAGGRTAGNDPERQWLLRSSWELPGQMELDASVRHVGELPAPHIPAYTAVDLRFGWRPNDRLELSLTGQNIFDSTHIEFENQRTFSEIERAFRVGIKWSF